MEDDFVALAVLRRPDGLFVLRVRRYEWEGADEYGEVRVPLPETDETRALRSAWDALAAVGEVAPQVLDAVSLVLRETVTDPEADRPALPALTIAPPPPPHKPTAANPRAYKGTKDRPPKPRRPDPVDLRPFLCVVGGQDRLVEVLTGHLGPVELPAEEREAPSGFRLRFAWWLRARDPALRDAALAVFHALELARDRDLCCRVAFLFARFPQTAAGWCELLAASVPERRRRMLDAVWARGVPGEDVRPVLDGLLEVDRRTSRAQFPQRLHYALERCVLLREPIGDVIATFALLDGHAPDQELEPDHRPPSPAGCASIAAFLDALDEVHGWLVRQAVVHCGRFPGAARNLEAIARADLAPAHRRALGAAVTDLRDAEQVEDVRRHLDACVAAVVRAPAAYRDKAVRILEEFVYENTTDTIDFAARWIDRICRPPFAESGYFAVALEVYDQLPERLQEVVLDLPDATLQTLEDRTRRKDDAYLVATGHLALIYLAPEAFVESLAAAPAALCRATRLLGLFSKPARDAIIRELMATGILEASPADAESAARLLRLGDAGRHVPRQLRLHLDGEAELRPGQVDRHLERLRAAWPAVRCDVLEHLALQELQKGLVDARATDPGELSARMTHALMLQVEVTENRRALRRLIKACAAGDAGYVAAHPLNARWLAAHPKVAADVWLRGVRLSREIDGSTVTAAFETDPLEALRLGTYVGSCLGVGGAFSYAAAATVLDVNKQVVFARDAAGRFLARQIVGITEDDRLACFSIYPKVGAGLQELFRDFDRELAAALDLEIYVAPASDEEDAGGDVATILARDWWDDGCWDLTIDPD